MRFNKGFLDILLLGCLWGPSFLFMKIANSDIAPLTLITLRVALGAFILFCALSAKKIRLWQYRHLWWRCFVVGVFSTGLPFVCFNYSIETIPTSLSALINGLTPVFTIVLASIFLKDERLSISRAIGVVLSVCGFCVLFLSAFLEATDSMANLSMDIKGILLSLIAASSYAIGMVYLRKNLPKAPSLVAPVMQLSSTLAYLLPLAFIFESPISMIASASLSTWLALTGLSVLGTAFAFIVYYRVIERQGATALSTVTYILPVIGTTLGVVFLEETIGLSFYIAAFFIFSGVLIINGVISLSFLKRGETFD